MANMILKKILNKPIESIDEEEEYVEPKIEEVDNGPFNNLIDTIYEGYRKNNIPKFQTKKSFAPSSLVWNHGICPRYWYLAFEGNTFYEYQAGKSITNMDSGTDRHARIQKAMEDAGVLISKEVATSYEDPPIFGYVDSFIKWDDTDYVVEIKTCNQDAFERHKKTNTASSYHILQLIIYMKIYKKTKGIILYENKNTHDLLAIPVNINQNHVDFLEYLFDWMKEVHLAWTNKTIPEVPFKNNSIKICMSCPLRDPCLSAPKGDIKIARRKDEKGQM